MKFFLSIFALSVSCSSALVSKPIPQHYVMSKQSAKVIESIGNQIKKKVDDSIQDLIFQEETADNKNKKISVEKNDNVKITQKNDKVNLEILEPKAGSFGSQVNLVRSLINSNKVIEAIKAGKVQKKDQKIQKVQSKIEKAQSKIQKQTGKNQIWVDPSPNSSRTLPVPNSKPTSLITSQLNSAPTNAAALKNIEVIESSLQKQSSLVQKLTNSLPIQITPLVQIQPKSATLPVKTNFPQVASSINNFVDRPTAMIVNQSTSRSTSSSQSLSSSSKNTSPIIVIDKPVTKLQIVSSSLPVTTVNKTSSINPEKSSNSLPNTNTILNSLQSQSATALTFSNLSEVYDKLDTGVYNRIQTPSFPTDQPINTNTYLQSLNNQIATSLQYNPQELGSRSRK